MNAIPRALPINNLQFKSAPPGEILHEDGNALRIDGYWQTPDGRTLFVACSLPGSILRRPS